MGLVLNGLMSQEVTIIKKSIRIKVKWTYYQTQKLIKMTKVQVT